MKRRTLLTLGAGVAAFGLAGHGPAALAAEGLDGRLLADLEPDAMWSIYRRYRLRIVGQRDDEMAGALAAAVVAALARFLPATRAQLSRAADTRRVGVLIGTNQQDVAVMASGECRGPLSRQATLRRYPQRAGDAHCLVRQPRPGVPSGFHGPPRLPPGADTGRARRHAAGARRRPCGSCPGAFGVARLFRRPRDAR